MKLQKILVAAIFVFTAGLSVSSLAFGQEPAREPADPQAQQEGLDSQIQETQDMSEITGAEYSFQQSGELKNQLEEKVSTYDDTINKVEDRLAELRQQRDKLDNQLIRLEYADQDNWNDVQSSIKSEVQDLGQGGGLMDIFKRD